MYKLKMTLWIEEDDSITYCKLEDDWHVWAKKGQLFEIKEITPEIREEYHIDYEYNYLAIKQSDPYDKKMGLRNKEEIDFYFYKKENNNVED